MGKKVLLIDDDADDRDLFREALEQIAPDLICDTVPDGRKAIQALRSEQVELPDLIFLDINMPIMNGWQCLSLLKQQEAFRSIPVIMYSTSSHLEDAHKAQHEGAFCYFNKPFNFNELKKSLELVVDHLRKETLSLLVENPRFFAAS